eukprot:1136551-Pelagomonas_calceolata.AAC.7
MRAKNLAGKFRCVMLCEQWQARALGFQTKHVSIVWQDRGPPTSRFEEKAFTSYAHDQANQWCHE